MALNEYAQIQDESLKCELQNCYFTKYNNGDYLNRKNSFRVQRALDKLWNMDELRYRGIIFNNEKLRDIIMNEMDPSVLSAPAAFPGSVPRQSSSFRRAHSRPCPVRSARRRPDTAEAGGA